MLRLLVLVLLVCSVVSTDADPTLVSLHSKTSKASNHRACTADELLPDYTDRDLSAMWSEDSMISPPFDCTCNTLKASYYCPSLGTEGYPKWIPRAVADNECKPISRESLRHSPLPPGFRVLFYGNSHLRQVMEGIVCAFQSSVKKRRVTVVSKYDAIRQDVIVEPEVHCRSCVNSAHSMMTVLVDHGCVKGAAKTRACSCDDDNSVFEFDNGSVLHYHFAHKEEGKRIEDALRVHGTNYKDYDAVVANLGNEPRMETSELLRTAERLSGEDVPLFWLTAYEGEGDIRDWDEHEREQFERSGARFLPVHDMVASLRYLTKGVVEGEFNPHFCMPGPPNEIGVLLLKLAWALHGEKERRDR